MRTKKIASCLIRILLKTSFKVADPVEEGELMSRLEMKNISKEFPGVKALQNVNFEIEKKEIHALIGANGAGKSTLMKVLTGVYSDYSGEILLDGKKLDLHSPQDAKENGIITVFQEVDTALIPYLTVAENIMMDYISRKETKAIIDWKYIRGEAKKITESLGLDIDVNKIVSDLSLSEKQMVLIGRAVSQKAKYLLLDEPTAPLSVEETKKLFDIVRKLQNDGVSVVFISHRLDEIFEICEVVTVLKDGKLVGTYDLKDMTIESVVEKMLGKKLDNTYPKAEVEPGEVLFETNNLSGAGGIESIDMNTRAGEVVGLAGLVGAGKTELCKLLFGADTIDEGEIKLKGKTITPLTPNKALKSGLAFVPEERRKEGILVEESIETNITLPTLDKYCKSSFMSRLKIKSTSKTAIKDVGVKTPNEKQTVANLSGGNQQKVAIGKWIISDAEVFIFDEPTKGVDVGSKAEIYELISGLVKKGKSVIYATCEFSEILGLTDRVYVMYNGQISKELKTKETNEEELLYYSAGGKDEK